MVKISIVTVCFNSAKTIEQTIKSVINQSYNNIEYIIIDGGSTDGTLDVIKKYEPYISYWVSEPDKGIYDAMNKGIRAATGELLGFINSDDWYEKDILGKYVNKYQLDQADVLYGDLTIVDDSGAAQQHWLCDDVCFDYFYFKMVIPHPTTFIKTKILKENMFSTKNKLVSDYELLLRLFVEGHKFQYVGKGTVVYFRNSGISASKKWLGYLEYRRFLKKMIKEYHLLLPEKTKKQINNKRLFSIFDYIIEKKQSKLLKVITNGLLTRQIKNIVVFGAGEIGRLVIMLLGKYDVNVTVVDNDQNKHGMPLFGHIIKSPKELQELSHGIILIANYIYSDEILFQLKDSEISDKIEILPFDNWAKYIVLNVFGVISA